MGKFKNHRAKSLICLITMIIGTLSSCNLEKKIVYFQDSQDGEIIDTYKGYTPKFKADDVLSILVTADDPVSTEPFNIEISAGANIRGNSGYLTGAPGQGYLVDSLGIVNMPVIGKIKLAGLNRIEATLLLEKELEKYLMNPVVQIRIVNFKITVLGEVERPGTFSIPNERITILEAIGLAGDLKITGKRENIKIIRNIEGKQYQYVIDLTSKNSFKSPVYYLEQNDVVYIEPNKSQRTQSTFWVRSGALIVSVSSLIISTIAVVTK